jgi:hypothetical protein
MNEYLQKLIKDFPGKDFKNFSGYVYSILQREIDFKKKKVDKDKYIKIRNSILGYIGSNEQAITSKLRKNKSK